MFAANYSLDAAPALFQQDNYQRVKIPITDSTNISLESQHVETINNRI